MNSLMQKYHSDWCYDDKEELLGQQIENFVKVFPHSQPISARDWTDALWIVEIDHWESAIQRVKAMYRNDLPSSCEKVSPVVTTLGHQVLHVLKTLMHLL